MRIFVLQGSRLSGLCLRAPGRRPDARILAVIRLFHNREASLELYTFRSNRKVHLLPKPSWSVLRSFATVPPTPDDDKKNDDDDDDYDDDDDTKQNSAASNKRELFNIWLQQLKSPPNLITLSRILSTPVLSYLIVSQNYEWALAGCFAAGLSDVLDGFLAKRYNMGTVLGTYLDPFADKLLINVLSVSLWYSDILPTPLILLWLSRDVLLIGTAYYMVANQTNAKQFVVDPTSTPLKVEPTNISKVNTAFQFLTLGVGLLQPIYNVTPGLLEALCWITGGTTIASGFSYVGGGALTASGNKIRETVQKEALALRDRARRTRRRK